MGVGLATQHAPALAAATDALVDYQLAANSAPNFITAGPDGNLWFTETARSANKVGRITPGGVITEFQIPTPDAEPLGITGGPDGNVWFVEASANKVAKVTPSGAITEFALPSASNRPGQITTGPDKNLWVTESRSGGIVRITPAGDMTRFSLPAVDTAISPTNPAPAAITTGPDGALWFVANGTDYNDAVGRITTDGAVTYFKTRKRGEGIALGPDGSLWLKYSEGSLVPRGISRLTAGGVFTHFPIATEVYNGLDIASAGITSGSDGNLWFTENQGGKVAKITPAGVVTEFRLRSTYAYPWGITSGPDGNIWFVQAAASKISRIRTDALPTDPAFVQETKPVSPKPVALKTRRLRASALSGRRPPKVTVSVPEAGRVSGRVLLGAKKVGSFNETSFGPGNVSMRLKLYLIIRRNPGALRGKKLILDLRFKPQQGRPQTFQLPIPVS